MNTSRNALVCLGDSIKTPKRRFADGGAISDAQATANRMCKEYGVGCDTQPAPKPAPPPPQPTQTASAEPSSSGGLLGRAKNLLANRSAVIDKATGYANGGKINGPGTPTSDSIPAKVSETGEPIKVSTQERIVSHAQDQFLETLATRLGFKSLDHLLESGTGKPVGPTVDNGETKAAYGMGPQDDQPLLSVTTGTPDPYKAAANVPATYAAASTPINISMPNISANTGANDPYAQAASAMSRYAPTTATRSTPDSTSGTTTGDNMSTPPVNPLELAKTNQLPTSFSQSAPAQSTPVGYTPAVKSYGVDTTQQPGISKIGGLKSPLYTNADNPLDAINGVQGVRSGGPALAVEDMTTANERSARANAIRRSMLDDPNLGGGGPKVAMIENSGLKESQALMDKWGMETLAKQNPQAASLMIGHNANRDRTAMDAMHDQTTRRGQDITASTQAAQLAGNPFDNALKNTQNSVAQLGADKLKQQSNMLAAIQSESDPAKRQSMIEGLLASQGKNPTEHRYIKVEGGEYIGPDRFTKMKAPSGVYDSVSKQFVPLEPAPNTPNRAATPSTADLEFTAKKYGMTVDQVRAKLAERQK